MSDWPPHEFPRIRRCLKCGRQPELETEERDKFTGLFGARMVCRGWLKLFRHCETRTMCNEHPWEDLAIRRAIQAWNEGECVATHPLASGGYV